MFAILMITPAMWKQELGLDSFIVDLGVALEEFDLQLNNKKTKIEELPDTVLEDWVRKLNGFVY